MTPDLPEKLRALTPFNDEDGELLREAANEIAAWREAVGVTHTEIAEWHDESVRQTTHRPAHCPRCRFDAALAKRKEERT